MRPRLTLALLAGRTASLVSRRIGYGGSVLPGHVVPRIEPKALRHIVRQLRHGSVLISGTNGKSTTARMVSHVAEGAGLHPIHNRSGANLMTGLIAAAAGSSNLRGQPRGDLGIFEVDEATLPAAVQAISPQVITLTNVFRDQLDRYGEVELVATGWRAAVATLDPSATVILNADDPTVAQLIPATKAQVVTFGFQDRSVGIEAPGHDADRRLCPLCSSRLVYTWSAYSHLGHYACEGCDWSRPTPDVLVTEARIHPGGSNLTIELRGESAILELPLPGLYNAYNALAAVATCASIGIPLAKSVELLHGSKAVFGRFERVPIGDGSLIMALVKNPVGFNQVLQTLAVGRPVGVPPAEPDRPSAPLMLIAINDRFADGTDVSWLWDVDFELLANRGYRIVSTGLRAADMALRLKYAGVSCVETIPDLAASVDAAIAATRQGGEVLVFPTYTAMLELRRLLQRHGHVAPFWEN